MRKIDYILKELICTIGKICCGCVIADGFISKAWWLFVMGCIMALLYCAISALEGFVVYEIEKPKRKDTKPDEI